MFGFSFWGQSSLTSGSTGSLFGLWVTKVAPKFYGLQIK